MIKITVNNSYSQATGLSADQHKALAAKLSYLVGDHFSAFGPRRVSLLDKRGNFPTGLLRRVMGHLRMIGEYELGDFRNKPISGSRVNLPDLSQSVVLDTAQQDAVLATVKRHQGIISMPTGSGKSLVIAIIASRLNVRTLVVVPSLEIKKQLQESIKSVLGDHYDITVENIDSSAIKTLTGFDCLIIDEAHHSAAATYRKLNKTAWTGIYYRYFMTATPFRNDNEETLLFESICGQVIYQLSFQDAVKSKRIVPVEAYYLEVPKTETDAFTWAQVYSELVVNNCKRNDMICYLALTIKEPVLIIVKEIKHGELLAQQSGIAFANGQDEASRYHIKDFNTGAIRRLIGTEGIIGEGVDSRPCEFVIIAGLGKAKSAFMQKVGRCLRNDGKKESGKVILFRDTSHKFTLRHFNEQKKILKEEYGVVAVKLDV